MIHSAIESMTLEPRDGFDLEICVHADYHSHPSDNDGLTQKQVFAWLDDQWHYVSLHARASLDGVTLGEYWLHGIEYGEFLITDDQDNPQKTVSVYLKDIWEDGYTDVIDEAIAQAKEQLKRFRELMPAGEARCSDCGRWIETEQPLSETPLCEPCEGYHARLSSEVTA
ncbi:MAG: hypothetical protein EBS38_02525 [Actinobacteria bacterium]|nr:hypothetical protein [Actinomycetota bacterium]